MIKSRNIKPVVKYVFIDPTYARLENVEVENKGVLVQTCKVVVHDPREEFKDLRFRDFSLENLIKLDSPLLKNDCQLHADNIDDISNAFANAQKVIQTQEAVQS